MEVVVIDKATFERMLSGFEDFAKKVERLCREHEDLGEREWLDSKISHKVYYRPEDVKAIFPVVGMKRRIVANKGREWNNDTGNQ